MRMRQGIVFDRVGADMATPLPLLYLYKMYRFCVYKRNHLLFKFTAYDRILRGIVPEK